MYLEQRLNVFRPPQFNLATNTILGTTQRFAIDRTYPIEEIVVRVSFSVTTAMDQTSPTTPDMWDNILQIVQKINLSVNDGRQPRSVVDCSGVALLEYAEQVGLTNDDATNQAIAVAANNNAAGVPVGLFVLTYRIPMVPPSIGEPLRSRCYLPVHTHNQDPILSLTFNTIAGMSANNTGVIGNVFTDVVLIRRVPTAGSEKLLRSTAGSNPTGYIDFDLIETPFAVPLGQANEIRFAVPTPGNYTGMVFRQYLGGATLTRKNPVDSNAGDSVAHNFGIENLWRLETGLVVVRQWSWAVLRTINDWTRTGTAPFLSPLTPFVAASSAGSPTSALQVIPANFPVSRQASTAYFRAGTSTYLDFLGDGTGDTGNELGSLLDCNTPANNGLKMELIGTPASVATNQSVIYMLGHRLLGDISRWQKF